VSGDSDGIVEIGNEIQWWTFAGGRINSTLRYVLKSLGGDWAITTDNLHLTVRGDDLTIAHFRQVLNMLRTAEVWNDAELWQSVSASLPAYRLSKWSPTIS
jgi:ATP-dependent helicase Lhr and Lhr-like helicase